MTREQLNGEQHKPPESWPAGRKIISRVREAISDGSTLRGTEEEDVFQTLYLTERSGCVPDHLMGDDLLVDIRSMYYWVFAGIREELDERVGAHSFIFTVIDPSYDDATWALLIHSDRVLLNVSRKAWDFYWESEEEMADELETWYQVAAGRLGVNPGSRTDTNILNSRRIKELIDLGNKVNDEEVVKLESYFTTLAELVDNELLGEMKRFGIESEQLSVLAHSSYNENLYDEVEEQRLQLRMTPMRAVVLEIHEAAKEIIKKIHDIAERLPSDQGLQFLVSTKPEVQEVVSQLQLAVELVGSTQRVEVNNLGQI